MKTNTITRIEYEDGPGGYRAVIVEPPFGSPDFRFETGDPVKDWADAKAKSAEFAVYAPSFLSSTCTHFLFDVPGYRLSLEGDIELDPLDWTDGVLTPAAYEDEDENTA